MGIETVKEEILNSAKEQSSSLIAEARKESNRIARETEKKIEEMRAKSEADAKRIMDAIKRQELASAELDNKKLLLGAKKQAIENVFAESRKKLESMDDKKRELIVKKLLDKAKSEIEIANVYCNKKDSKSFKGMNVEILDMIGGLIAENKEGTVRIDYSFDTMLQSIKENELQNINKTLFA
ncbi:hypothetical protein HYV80_03690 [Candidatus Woesearchaeota archaeon]|nr:hypothetical protein [Candidatus Woesearchaeota archaeon]